MGRFSAKFPAVKVLLLSLISGLMGYYYMGILSFGLPQFQKRFQISDSEIGLFIAMLRLGLIPAILVTFLVDFIGRKPVILFSKFILIVCSIISGVTKSTSIFATSQFIAFMFIAAETSIVVVLVSELSLQNKKALTMSMLTGFSSIGTGFSVFVYGVNSYFRLPVQFAYFYAIPLLFLLLFLQSSMEDSLMIKLKTYKTGLNESIKKKVAEWWKVMHLSSRRMISISLIGFLFDATIVPAFFFASTYLQHTHGFQPQYVSMLIIISGSIATIITIILGHVSDIVGHKKLLIIMMLATVVSIIFFYNTHGIALYITWLMFIVSSAAVSNTYVTICAEIFHVTNRVSAMGIRAMFSTIGASIGFILQGCIFSYTHSNSSAICLITGFILIGVVLTYIFIPESSGEIAESYDKKKVKVKAT
jgi:MFS family permease